VIADTISMSYDELFASVQPESVARRLRAQRGVDRLVLGPAVQCEREQRVACGDPRQPGPCLVGIGTVERRDRGDRGGEEGRRRQVAADLLEHDPRLDMPQAESAMLLADQDAGEAHLGELRPQVAREAGGVVGVAQRAHMADRCVLGDEAADRVLQSSLVVVEEEGHLKLRHPSAGWDLVRHARALITGDPSLRWGDGRGGVSPAVRGSAWRRC
jgi:hypothetical protein